MAASEEELIAFFERERYLLQVERDEEIKRSALILSGCSARLLEVRGLALIGLGVVGINIGLGGKSLVELERPAAYHTSLIFPPHTLRPGDLARIEEHTTVSKKAIKGSSKSATTAATKAETLEGVVYKVSDSRIIIAIDESNSFEIPERCRVLKLANSATFDRMQRALDDMERLLGLPSSSQASSSTSRPPASQQLTPLIRVLFSLSPPSPLPPSPLPPSFTFLDPSLNDSQKEAVKFAMGVEEVGLIHGPPGTGKTHTLIEIIRQLVKQDKSVLVCGASNLAVDNILERLLPHSIPCTRLGHPARTLPSLTDSTLDSQAARSDEAVLAKDVKLELEGMLDVLAKGGREKGRVRGAERRRMWDEVKELRKEYRKREGKIVRGVLGKAKVVLATCHTSGSHQLQNKIFDVVVIDEATQAMEPVCWIPILKGKKLILAGDPKQLPPTVISASSHSTLTSTKVKGKTGANANASAAKKESNAIAAGKKKGPQPAPSEPHEDSSSDTSSSSSETESSPPQPTPNPPSASSSKKKNQSKSKTGLRPPKSLTVTLFDRLENMYGNGVKKMLTVQYRMNEKISAFPSKELYSSLLKSHPSVQSHLLSDLLPSSSSSAEKEKVKEVLGEPIVFFDTAGCEYWEKIADEEGKGLNDEGSKCNENEAAIVASWVGKLVEAGILPSQIAVITPYQAQVTLLSSLLRPSMPELEIGTVDGMQGREKEAVVLSLVRSNDQREVGFLKEKRRLNVAMTRPRRHLCVVGDSSTISHGGKYLKKWLAWLEENADVRYAGLE